MYKYTQEEPQGLSSPKQIVRMAMIIDINSGWNDMKYSRININYHLKRRPGLSVEALLLLLPPPCAAPPSWPCPCPLPSPLFLFLSVVLKNFRRAAVTFSLERDDIIHSIYMASAVSRYYWFSNRVAWELDGSLLSVVLNFPRSTINTRIYWSPLAASDSSRNCNYVCVWIKLIANGMFKLIT